MAKKLTEKKIRKLVGIVVVLIAAVIGLFDTLSSDETDISTSNADITNCSAQVHFVDVGQGDATLVVSKGEAMLVDTGERDELDTLLNYLKKMNIDSLKYLVITHPHTDHMGEAGDILKAVSTERIIMPKVTGNMTPTNSTYKNFLKTLKNLNKKVTAAKDEILTLGNAKVQLFTTKKEHRNLSNYSVLVKVVDGKNSFLITGDCEFEEENEMMAQGFDLDSNVLKVAHHGSYSATSAKFLNYVNPQYAVISCAKDNKYGHPHSKTVKRLKSHTKNYYVTADDGTIIFISDGKGLSIETER